MKSIQGIDEKMKRKVDWKIFELQSILISEEADLQSLEESKT